MANKTFYRRVKNNSFMNVDDGGRDCMGKARDSQGNWGSISYMSELGDVDPTILAAKMYERMPDFGTGEMDRFNKKERKGMFAMLRVAFSLLPEKQRCALYFRYFQDLSMDEVAKAMGVSKAAAHDEIHRAERHLRHIVSDEIINETSSISGVVRKRDIARLKKKLKIESGGQLTIPM